MREALLFAGLLGFAYAGFLLLALSQKQNWKRALPDVSVAAQPSARRLRATGSALLTLSFALALLRDGSAFGPILWVVSLTIAGGLVAATVTTHRSWLWPVMSVFRSGK